MNRDTKLARSLDFLRLLVARIESGEFEDIKVTYTGSVDFQKSVERGLIEYTDKEPVAWRILAIPRRQP